MIKDTDEQKKGRSGSFLNFCTAERRCPPSIWIYSLTDWQALRTLSLKIFMVPLSHKHNVLLTESPGPLPSLDYKE